MVRRITHLCALLLAVLIVGTLPGCRRLRRMMHRHRAPAVAAHPIDRARVARGNQAYQRYCALCHRADGSGYAADHANAIANPDFLRTASDEFIRTAIIDGHIGTPMSAWGRRHGGPLSDETVDDIVYWLRSRSHAPHVNVDQRRVVAGSAENGRRIFSERCQSCHGPRGEGAPTATSLSHPTFQRSASNGFIRYTIEHGRRGTPMIGFADVGSQGLDDLTAFIRTLEREPNLAPPAVEYEPPPGLEALVINREGRPPHFTLREDRYVPAADVAHALEAHQRMVILDARPTTDWNNGHIPGALPYPFYNIEEMAAQLPNDGTWILAYCACPHAASGHVVDELRRRNFRNTAVIDEGIHGWQSQGFPMARGVPRTPVAP